MSPPWMLVRLALDTSIHQHQADEDRLSAIDLRSNPGYRAFLHKVYGFEAAVEAAIARSGVESMFTHGRYKADLLRSDLAALGATEDPIRAEVSIRSPAHAMGWLFVLERHTLLSGLIRRHIQRTLGDVPVGYLSAYNERPGIRFRAFGDALGVCAQRHTPRAIIAGANEAFRAQRSWYEAGPRPSLSEAFAQ
ncbi:MAG: biliverdin-producing heme oxygenase [Deltaproteobacteria bacterium]|nr:biliverdin-producing heme oxygenase [Deltaproteobacteria bacterium]